MAAQVLSCRALQAGSVTAVPSSGEDRVNVLGRSVTLMPQMESNEERLAKFQKCCDVINEVGQYADASTLVSMTAACKDWNNFLVHHEVKGVQLGALSLRRAALRSYVAQHGFGLQKWKQYFGQDPFTWRGCMQLGLRAMKRTVFGAGEQIEKSRLPLEVLDILESPCPFFKKQKKETCFLFYLPKTFEGKPVTLRSLGKLVENLKKGSGGYSTRCYANHPAIMEQYGDEPTKASCWILMTRAVIPGSDHKSFEEQRVLISRWRELEIPKVLEAVAGVLLNYVKTGKKWLPGEPTMHTCCQEQIRYTRSRISVSCFVTYGLFINNFDWSSVAVLQKFPNA